MLDFFCFRVVNFWSSDGNKYCERQANSKTVYDGLHAVVQILETFGLGNGKPIRAKRTTIIFSHLLLPSAVSYSLDYFSPFVPFSFAWVVYAVLIFIVANLSHSGIFDGIHRAFPVFLGSLFFVGLCALVQ